jgi:hypothetical protein
MSKGTLDVVLIQSMGSLYRAMVVDCPCIGEVCYDCNGHRHSKASFGHILEVFVWVRYNVIFIVALVGKG